MIFAINYDIVSYNEDHMYIYVERQIFPDYFRILYVYIDIYWYKKMNDKLFHLMLQATMTLIKLI